ncbi:DMT family transporter [Futiania mangrovi]|uniref:DMT family transporter n=1 Tax=Futiania mangrovi TaxID=2959716 RepID=A0A9J6PEG9_9PROT|nr:DMT family transporter [Futiania mangrovii]MCP1337081.1 DMT family transporter [Futiania mangrovii]
MRGAARHAAWGADPLTPLWLLVVILAWGGNYAVVKLALRDMAPFSFNALRFGGAWLCLLLLLSVTRTAILPPRAERIPLAVVGVFQVTVMLGLTSLALLWIEASRAVLIAYSLPIWTTLFDRLILGIRLTAHKVAGLAMGLAGLAILLEPWRLDWTGSGVLAGSALGLAGTIGWSLGATLYKRRVWEAPLLSQVQWQVGVGFVPLLLLALIFEADAPIDPTARLAVLAVYNWIIPAALAYWCWSRVLMSIPPSAAAQFLMLAPVWGVMLGIVFLDEPALPSLWISGALILGGALISMRKRS